MIEKNIRRRLKILVFFTLIIGLIITIRIIYLVSINPAFYSTIEKNEIPVRRGDILDTNGIYLAVSDQLKSVYASPKEIKDINKTAEILHTILAIPKKNILKQLNSKKNFVWIKRHISPYLAKKIAFQKLSGINFITQYKRFYPNRELASHIVGFCDIDSNGVEGIEKSMNSYLAPSKVFSKNNYLTEETPEGASVHLTIDANIQAIAENVLSKHFKEENPESVSLILLNGITGEILSMANYPDYNPNLYFNYKQKYFRNFAIFNQYEPGSVFKIFSLASIIDSGGISADSFFYCDGIYTKGKESVKCTGKHGTINYAGIIKYSCNDGMLQAAEHISKPLFYKYLKTFGFGERTTTLLSGEQPGVLRNYTDWSQRSMLAIPIGQEISVNALQIVKAATVFVNDGILIRPYIVKSVVNPNGKILLQKSRREIRRVIKKGIAGEILYGMMRSTEAGGTSHTLSVNGIQFTAKSGTAQIYDNKTKKYSDKNLTSSILTIFPYSNPKYILYVVFNKPKGKIKWGGVIGAKVVNDFVSALSGYLPGIYNDSYSIDNKAIFINNKITPITTVPTTMPDISNLSAGDVVYLFSKITKNIKIFGTGKIYKQFPNKGETINKDCEIKIYLKE